MTLSCGFRHDQGRLFPAGHRLPVRDARPAACPGYRLLALLTSFMGARLGASVGRHQATSGHIGPEPMQVNGPLSDARPLPATDGACTLAILVPGSKPGWKASPKPRSGHRSSQALARLSGDRAAWLELRDWHAGWCAHQARPGPLTCRRRPVDPRASQLAMAAQKLIRNGQRLAATLTSCNAGKHTPWVLASGTGVLAAQSYAVGPGRREKRRNGPSRGARREQHQALRGTRWHDCCYNPYKSSDQQRCVSWAELSAGDERQRYDGPSCNRQITSSIAVRADDHRLGYFLWGHSVTSGRLLLARTITDLPIPSAKRTRWTAAVERAD